MKGEGNGLAGCRQGVGCREEVDKGVAVPGETHIVNEKTKSWREKFCSQ